MNMTRTHWYPANIKPIREGVYEVRNSTNLRWNNKNKLIGNARYFDGKNWMAGWNDDVISIFGKHDSHQWRGLKNKP